MGAGWGPALNWILLLNKQNIIQLQFYIGVLMPGTLSWPRREDSEFNQNVFMPLCLLWAPVYTQWKKVAFCTKDMQYRQEQLKRYTLDVVIIEPYLFDIGGREEQTGRLYQFFSNLSVWMSNTSPCLPYLNNKINKIDWKPFKWQAFLTFVYDCCCFVILGILMTKSEDASFGSPERVCESPSGTSSQTKWKHVNNTEYKIVTTAWNLQLMSEKNASIKMCEFIYKN